MAHTRKKMFYAPKAFNGYGPPGASDSGSSGSARALSLSLLWADHPPGPAGGGGGLHLPVCWWENDVFISSDNEPSDENHGLTLSQGRENVRRFGTCDPRMKR